MFERPHHQRILKVLQTFDSALLHKLDCYFGGGTAIALSLGEYRESVDIDFMCATQEGYRALRGMVNSTINPLLKSPLKHLREVRTDPYKVLTFLEVDGVNIKVELVWEARIQLSGHMHPTMGVPILCRGDMYAEKLLANADRGLDKQTNSRDIIDLAMMMSNWGPIPQESWNKVSKAYGEGLIERCFQKSVQLISDRKYLNDCLHNMEMNSDLHQTIVDQVEVMASNLPMNEAADAERSLRISGLNHLDQTDDVQRVFAKHAQSDPTNWSKAEMATVEECLSTLSMNAGYVDETLQRISPGLISKNRCEVITSRIDDFAEALCEQIAEKSQPQP